MNDKQVVYVLMEHCYVQYEGGGNELHGVFASVEKAYGKIQSILGNVAALTSEWQPQQWDYPDHDGDYKDHYLYIEEVEVE